MDTQHSQYECGWLRGGVSVERGMEEVRGKKKTQAETIWNARSHMGQSLSRSCARELCQGAVEETLGVVTTGTRLCGRKG